MAVKEQNQDEQIKPQDEEQEEPTILEIEDDEEVGFDWEITKRLLGYLHPHRRKMGIAIFAMLFSVFANVSGPPLIGYAIDEGIRTRDMSVVALGVQIGRAHV